MMHIDTHEAYKELVSAGLQDKQAESIVKLVEKSRKDSFDSLVTKQDLDSKIKELQRDIDSKFKIIYIVGGLVSTILVSPILSDWFNPIIARILHH